MQRAGEPENLRAEYAALSSYFNTLVGFRITLLGFFLASIALIISGPARIPVVVSLLAILLTFSMYLFELRTRILYDHLAKRGIEIEQREWGFAEEDSLPFFSRQLPRHLGPYGKSGNEGYYASPVKILFGLVTIRSRHISHSNALDLLYIGTMGFFIATLLFEVV